MRSVQLTERRSSADKRDSSSVWISANIALRCAEMRVASVDSAVRISISSQYNGARQRAYLRMLRWLCAARHKPGRSAAKAQVVKLDLQSSGACDRRLDETSLLRAHAVWAQAGWNRPAD